MNKQNLIGLIAFYWYQRSTYETFIKENIDKFGNRLQERKMQRSFTKAHKNRARFEKLNVHGALIMNHNHMETGVNFLIDSGFKPDE